MSIYLVCIYFMVGILAALAVIYMIILVVNRNYTEKNAIQNLRQKKATLYIKYDLKTQEIIINSKYSYSNLDIGKYILDICKDETFISNIKESTKDSTSFTYERKANDKIYYFTFFCRGKADRFTVLRCDYNIEKTIENVVLKSIDDVKLIHENNIDGMLSMNMSLLNLSAKGFISEREALANSNDPNELEKMFRGVYQGTKAYYE